jgi:hypothetical protein
LLFIYKEDSNSIAIIVNHLHGNLLSRWTNFLTTDGEKETRNRDGEFENGIKTKNQLIERWNGGWKSLFDTLNSLTETDLEKTIYIRNQGLFFYGCHYKTIGTLPLPCWTNCFYWKNAN